MNYLIWSYKRDAWWRAGGHGYTWDVAQAGRFDETAAHDITSSYIGDDANRSVKIEAALVYAMFEQDAERRKEEELERRNDIRVAARD